MSEELEQNSENDSAGALTDNEWRTLRLWNAGKMVGGHVRGKVVLDLPDDARRAAAAVALYGQPFGFTQDDVHRLRAAAAFQWEDDGFRLALSSVAERIAALLPPEK